MFAFTIALRMSSSFLIDSSFDIYIYNIYIYIYIYKINFVAHIVVTENGFKML